MFFKALPTLPTKVRIARIIMFLQAELAFLGVMFVVVVGFILGGQLAGGISLVQLVPLLLAFTVALVWSATGLNHDSKPAWLTAIALECLVLVGLALNFVVTNIADLLVDSALTISCVAVLALLSSSKVHMPAGPGGSE